MIADTFDRVITFLIPKRMGKRIERMQRENEEIKAKAHMLTVNGDLEWLDFHPNIRLECGCVEKDDKLICDCVEKPDAD